MFKEEEITEFLENYTHLLILGIGNELREDDALGPVLIKKLSNTLNIPLDDDFPYDDYFQAQNNIKHTNPPKNKVTLLNTGSVPENYTGLIMKIKPSHIIILDAVNMNTNPGEIALVKKENISKLSISTHAMSLATLIRYLESQIKFKIILIGIQPEKMGLNIGLSSSVEESTNKINKILSQNIK